MALQVVAPTPADQRIATMRVTAREDILRLAVHKRHSAKKRRNSIARMRGYVHMAASRRGAPLESIALRRGQPIPDKRAAQAALAEALYGHPKGLRGSMASLVAAESGTHLRGATPAEAPAEALRLPTAAEEEEERSIRNAARRAVDV